MDCSMLGFPCSSLSPGVCSHSCPLSLWCHPTVSSSITRFSSCPQSFLAPPRRHFPGGAVIKNPSANAGDTRDMGSIIVLGRSPGVGNDSLLQYSCWETPWTEELNRLLSLELQRVDTTEHTQGAWSWFSYKGHKIKGDTKGRGVKSYQLSVSKLTCDKFDFLETDFTYEPTFAYVHALLWWKIIVHILFPRYVWMSYQRTLDFICDFLAEWQISSVFSSSGMCLLIWYQSTYLSLKFTKQL